jgi:hypothetical protein
VSGVVPSEVSAARYARYAARSAAPFAPSTVMGGGFACTFHGHPYGSTRSHFALSTVIRTDGTTANFAPSTVIITVSSPSVAFPDWSPLLPVYSRSRAVVFPTSPYCSMRG